MASMFILLRNGQIQCRFPPRFRHSLHCLSFQASIPFQLSETNNGSQKKWHISRWKCTFNMIKKFHRLDFLLSFWVNPALKSSNSTARRALKPRSASIVRNKSTNLFLFVWFGHFSAKYCPPPKYNFNSISLYTKQDIWLDGCVTCSWRPRHMTDPATKFCYE